MASPQRASESIHVYLAHGSDNTAQTHARTTGSETTRKEPNVSSTFPDPSIHPCAPPPLLGPRRTYDTSPPSTASKPANSRHLLQASRSVTGTLR
ncbi:hypothetical protein MRX96_013924 [Rhipicephalus microplus]